MNEQEIRQALATLEMYKTQAESLAEQQQIISFSLEEYSRARDTLGKWKDAAEGAELLVPVGGNSFVFAKGVDAAPRGIGGGTCANLFRLAGYDAYVWQTVDEMAHSVNEYCRVDNLVDDAKVYATVLSSLCFSLG